MAPDLPGNTNSLRWGCLSSAMMIARANGGSGTICSLRAFILVAEICQKAAADRRADAARTMSCR